MIYAPPTTTAFNDQRGGMDEELWVGVGPQINQCFNLKNSNYRSILRMPFLALVRQPYKQVFESCWAM